MRKNKSGRVSRDFMGLEAWEAAATKQEKNLKTKAIEYDRIFFDDFNFEPNSITGNVYNFARIKNPPELLAKNKLYECTPTVIQDCRFHIKKFAIAGNCDGWDITIHPDVVKAQDILLHEMIHLRINVMPDHFKEILTVCLYKKLKKEIKSFEKMVINHATTVAAAFNPNYWYHGTLFFLKSLDLDMRLNLDLGTVYGYEWNNRESVFNRNG